MGDRDQYCECGSGRGKCVDCMVEMIDRLTKDNEQLKSDLLTLWSLLDDISTAGDMFKPEISPYFKYVNITCGRRSTVATSDGYEVFYSGEALK